MGCEAAERFQSADKIIRIQEVAEMAAQLGMAVIVVAFYRRLLDCAVNAIDLAIDPWMARFGQPLLNPVCLADQIEPHKTRVDGVTVSGLLCELDTVVRHGFVNCARHYPKEMFKELLDRLTVGFVYQLRDCELDGAVNGHEERQLAFRGTDLVLFPILGVCGN